MQGFSTSPIPPRTDPGALKQLQSSVWIHPKLLCGQVVKFGCMLTGLLLLALPMWGNASSIMPRSSSIMTMPLGEGSSAERVCTGSLPLLLDCVLPAVPFLEAARPPLRAPRWPRLAGTSALCKKYCWSELSKSKRSTVFEACLQLDKGMLRSTSRQIFMQSQKAFCKRTLWQGYQNPFDEAIQQSCIGCRRSERSF